MNIAWIESQYFVSCARCTVRPINKMGGLLLVKVLLDCVHDAFIVQIYNILHAQ